MRADSGSTRHTASPPCQTTELPFPLVTVAFLQPTIGTDMAAVDRDVRVALSSEVVLIQQVAEYIIGSGGKRLRPRWCCSRRAPAATTDRTVMLAAIIEFIHTATLLHDDVVDESDCGAAARPPTRCSAMPPACWWAISCIRARSR